MSDFLTVGIPLWAALVALGLLAALMWGYAYQFGHADGDRAGYREGYRRGLSDGERVVRGLLS
jgi:hypothetical protein